MVFRTPWRGMVVVCAFGVASALDAGVAQAATISVAAGGDLQAAINAAQPGDTISLAAGATFAGNFVLTNKGASTTPIVIRSATPDSQLPGPGVRMTPAYAPLLAKLRSPNNMPVLRTAAAAHHWIVMLLEFGSNLNGYGDIIQLGSGESTQADLSTVPYNLVVDRVYVHGDALLGQKRGISLNTSDTTIRNSYISDCKAVGQDSQAIGGFNGPGNYLIENNHLEGAAENILFGGSDPVIPNLITTNITVRGNHLVKPLQWRDPIIATPAAAKAMAVPAGGALAAGTYHYKIVARRAAGQNNRANSIPTIEVSATLTAAGGVTISWAAVADAEDYLVYGRTSGGQDTYWKTTSLFFTDTGAAGTAGTPPTKGTKWSVKNLFELKNAQDVLVEGNVLENIWVADQTGYAVGLSPRNQNGNASWVTVQRVVIRNNLFRHTAGGINILGRDNEHVSQQTNHITIHDNIFDDMTSATWGYGSRFLILGDGADSIVVDHNTVDTTDSGIFCIYGGSITSPTPNTNVRYTNNMSRHNSYGIFGDNYATGTASINAYLPSGVVAGNVLAGGPGSVYPTGNYFPTVAEWQAQFVDYAGRNYRLLATSSYKNGGTDGRDLGADVDAVEKATAGAISGTSSSGVQPVRIMTTALPNGTYAQPYAQTLQCSGGSGVCGWTLQPSSLPPGLTFDERSGILAGTPAAAGTGALTVSAWDVAMPSNSTTMTLSVTVDAPPLTVSVPAPPSGQVGVPYRLTPAASGAMATVSWTVTSGSVPAGLAVDPVSGTISGAPVAWSPSSSFVLQASDNYAVGRTASAAVTIVVAPAPLAVGTTVLARGTNNVPYSAALIASGGTGNVAWVLAGGTLPPGISLASNGALSGTPSTAGTFAFSVTATDTVWTGYIATATLTLTVAPSSPQLPSGVIQEIVLYASKATTVAGNWVKAADATAAGGFRMWNPNARMPKITTPAAAPASYFEVTFQASANTPYHLWVRGKADGNTYENDSFYLQFSNSVNGSGAAINRIGTTAAAAVSIESGTNAGLSEWGWQDNAYDGFGDAIYFATSGAQTVRIQQREDGVSIDQIVLSATKYATAAPGASQNDTTILAESVGTASGASNAREVVLYAASAPVIAGNWSRVSDASAAGGYRLYNANAGLPKLTTPLASPTSYFELTFTADAGVPYHLWVRGRADGDYYENDSVYVQYSGSVTATGAAVNRIGTTSAATLIIEDGMDGGLSGWGWQDEAYGTLAPPVYFAASGTQTIRVQTREDGISIDQIVLSAGKYLSTAPGASKDDATVVAR